VCSIYEPKSETIQIIKDFVAEMELQHHKTPAVFRTDNGRELVTNDFKGFCESEGIKHEFTPPYLHESNRVAEHLNRTIGKALRAILESEFTYNKNIWAEDVLTTVYMKNFRSHSALKKITPDEAFKGRSH